MKWLAIVSLMFFAAAAGMAGYSQQLIVCPYCHNSNANVKGHCVLRQRTGSCSEDYYPQHHNLVSCPWCAGEGRMTRMTAFLD